MSAELIWVIVAGVVAVVAVMAIASVMTLRLRRIGVVDSAWGFAYVALALAVGLTAELVGPVGLGQDGDHPDRPWLRWLVVTMVVIWGLRLGTHLGRRILASTEDDPRYENLLGGSLDEIPFSRVLTKVYALQGGIVLVVALPVFIAVSATPRWSWLVVVGVPIWLLGLIMESTADRQLAAYKANPDRPRLMTTGVWSWSRHPNYFGDTCIWWGIWLTGAATMGWPGALIGVLGPIAMTYFLVAVSGVALAEKRMAGRPGWDEYAARTSVFVPLPPRRVG